MIQKLLKTMAVAASVAIAVNAQAQWTTVFKTDSTRLTLPDTGYVKTPNHFSFANENTGYVVAVTNVLWFYKTTDGGATWNLPFSNKFLNVGGGFTVAFSAISPTEFALATQDGKVYKSIDGGYSISEVATGVVTSPRSMQFKDDFGIVHNGSNKLAYSTNRGNSWQQKTVTAVASVDVVNATTAFIADGATLLKTTDAGTTWETPISLPTDLVAANYNELKQVSFINENEGYVSVRKTAGPYDYKLLKTTDGGTTWTNLTGNLPDSTYFYSLLAFDANTVFILSPDPGLGGNGKLRVSTDGGATFSAELPMWNTGTNVVKKAGGSVLWSAGDKIIKKGFGTSGIADTQIETINVYPNPANSTVTVAGIPIGSTVNITDIAGRLLYTANPTVENVTVNVRDFSAGVYFVKVENDNASSVKKLIIE